MGHELELWARYSGTGRGKVEEREERLCSLGRLEDIAGALFSGHLHPEWATVARGAMAYWLCQGPELAVTFFVRAVGGDNVVPQ